MRIDDQLRLTELNMQGQASRLIKRVLNNCKKPSRINGLGKLSELEHLRLCVADIHLDELLGSPLPVLALDTAYEKRNAEARARLKALGYSAT